MNFKPPWWLPCAHPQTLYGTLCAYAPEPEFTRCRWTTYDGDFVDVDFIDGPDDAPWVQLYHGLEGSSNSPYARQLMEHVRRRQWRGSVFHFRGCSGEPNLLRRAYHSGDSLEIDWSLRRAKSMAGDAPLYAVGVSLGGNALAKWLGESGDAARDVIAAAGIVSAPVDLTVAGPTISRGLKGLVYGWWFLRSLKKTALAKIKQHGGLDERKVRAARTLADFDEAVTAPLHGFESAVDYWTKSSAKPLLRGIRVPTLLVNAKDDPFMPGTALPKEHEVSNAVKLEFPDHGGHGGFVSGPYPGHIEWLPRRLLHFFEFRQ